MIDVFLAKNSDGDYEATASFGGLEGVPHFEVVTYSETGFGVAKVRMLKALRYLGFANSDGSKKVRWEYATSDTGERSA